MIKYLNILFFGFFINFFACKPEPNNIDDLHIIAPARSSVEIDLLEYIDDIEYIPLKETKDALLSTVVKMVKIEKEYIIKCHQRSALFFYDLEGNFTKKLVATGQGPYEFSNLMDIATDLSTKRIFLLDFEEKKILTYDVSKNVISSDNKTLDLHGYSLFHHNSKLYVGTMPNEAGRVKILDDKTMKITGEGVYDKSSTFNFIVTQNNMNLFRDTLFISASFSDTIYVVLDKNIEPYAVLGQGSQSLASLRNKRAYARKYLEHLDKLADLERYILVPRGFFFIYEDIWFIELIWANEMVIWNKKNANQYLIDFRNFKNRNLLFEYQLFKIMFLDDEGYAYSSIILDEYFYDIAQKVVESEKYSNKITNELSALLSDYPRGSRYENPVLVKFRLNMDLFDKL